MSKFWWVVFGAFFASAVVGCGGKTFDSESEIKALSLMNKSPAEVIEVMGKPKFVHTGGRLTSGRQFDESWTYFKVLRHKATGEMQDVKVFFDNERVIGWGVD